MAKLNYDIKQQMITLAGACFWYWNGFYTFLESCDVPRRLYEKYPKGAFSKYDVMRNILGDLEDADKSDILNNIISNFFRMRGPADSDVPDPEKARKLLQEFRESVGNDPIEKELERRKRDEAKKRYQREIDSSKSFQNRVEDLNHQFVSLHNNSDVTPQQRGYALENLFCDLLELNEIEYKRPYKTPDGEQIDGHFRYEKFDYLIESKWEQGTIKQKDLAIFDVKIRGKAQSTRGLFLAANGFDENAVAKFSGDSPRIILMTGEDLALILGGRIELSDALNVKLDAIVRYGNINKALREVVT